MPSPAALADAEQSRASDPSVSAFVSASAGSGKTKLLTDRLLRLMLAGADASRIQCLTFTKAAAAEMAKRLTQVLETWVGLADGDLDARLAALHVTPCAEARARARGLFLTVLDLPGGMRIDTIHAFCESLLRRFPLEAAISPHFRVIEELDAADGRRVARDHVIGDAVDRLTRDAIDHVAGIARLDDVGRYAAELLDDPNRLDDLRSVAGDLEGVVHRALGVEGQTETTLLAAACQWGQATAVHDAALRMQHSNAKTIRARAVDMLEWLAIAPDERPEFWGNWVRLFFNENGEPYAARTLVNHVLQRADPALLATLLAEQTRIGEIEEALRALRLARASTSMLRLMLPIATGYEHDKSRRGLLDFGDLISRSVALMVDPGSAWVLYKLDGGLDHLLLDEVQDTAPAQWRIADALVAEFYAGIGANEASRTIFAVGDRKQSIFSIQGAEPDAFDHWSEVLAERIEKAGRDVVRTPLQVSFRSTRPVLALVDAVFSQAAARPGVTAEGEDLRHYAHRIGDAGRVALWPLVPPSPREDPESWVVSQDYHGRSSAPQRLADHLADWIVDRIGKPLPSQDRALHAGDVLILIRRRNEFQRMIVRALKARHVPVAGVDRLTLTDQTAVADLLTLCDVLLLPQDDLSLACVMTGPLGGVSDDGLMDLAVGRKGTLWDALRERNAERPDWHRTYAMVAGLMARVDYVSPHMLLVETLGPLGGRAKLFARLGYEAAEPVDELLSQALAYEKTHAASLQGFLHWIRASDREVKRQSESAGNAVRVMTVHGAKGLQAPLVILPDTTGVPPRQEGLVWRRDPATGIEIPLWRPQKSLTCKVCEDERTRHRAKQIEEYNRLLYVALTRAEDELLVCGWQPRRKLSEPSWYDLVRGGFETLPGIETHSAESGPFDLPGEPIKVLAEQQTTTPTRRTGASRAQSMQALPEWAGGAPDWIAERLSAEKAQARAVAPSRGGSEDTGGSTPPSLVSSLTRREADAARLERGRLVHVLLQHLPNVPASDRAAVGRHYLTSAAKMTGSGDAEQILAQCLAIMDNADLAVLFDSHSQAEVPLTGNATGPEGELLTIGGLVDRLSIGPDMVTLADYKSQRTPPAAPGDTPTSYLRQMAAYRLILRDIFPDKAIRCLIIWTQTGRVDRLPDEILDVCGLDPLQVA